MDRRAFISTAVAATSLILFSNQAFSAEKFFTGLLPGVAIGGYDAVAYFSAGEAKPGDGAFVTNYENAEWRFASQENLDAFLAAPSQYAPQYGGYCAYAASKGALAKGDPEAWTIYEGKLYLNFSKSVRSIWQQDIPGHIEKANTNFPKLLETWPNVTEW
ncbi:YHS domain-containing (seleno)protein [uncultured Maritalea sp.]|uniref:YHS domain-containing (seleno)protein n=1 Tax=uncultured Maritalea sp. TaxID=757249 RepID=UPI00261F2311|nr:YHS domain-containing (seleno)protein [uncultured Maritalea sp.]